MLRQVIRNPQKPRSLCYHHFLHLHHPCSRMGSIPLLCASSRGKSPPIDSHPLNLASVATHFYLVCMPTLMPTWRGENVGFVTIRMWSSLHANIPTIPPPCPNRGGSHTFSLGPTAIWAKGGGESNTWCPSFLFRPPSFHPVVWFAFLRSKQPSA
jgi:hypothetical protein